MAASLAKLPSFAGQPLWGAIKLTFWFAFLHAVPLFVFPLVAEVQVVEQISFQQLYVQINHSVHYPEVLF